MQLQRMLCVEAARVGRAGRCGKSAIRLTWRVTLECAECLPMFPGGSAVSGLAVSLEDRWLCVLTSQ